MNNFKEINFLLSELYIKKGENYFWGNNNKMAFKMLFTALRCSKRNIKIYRTIYYILKNKKVK